MRKSLKIISALAASAIIIGAFAGCGGEKKNAPEAAGGGEKKKGKIFGFHTGGAGCLAGVERKNPGVGYDNCAGKGQKIERI